MYGKIRSVPCEPCAVTKIGHTISHYLITEKLGEGGMGIVYKAEDTKLERPVALKFLAAHLLEDEEARERFTREAKAAAALDHPNICTIHEIDEANGQTFLAMAYVEGQTVKEKIAERPLKLDEALDIAIQTTQGLQAAHEKGIVHRDIKSANLMVTPQGQVKIMDFGLAQLAERSKLTKTSTILGTPAYMSPEQTQRQPTNRRTDIWSLAVVIYEMVTGRLPFEGEREQAVLYAIAREEPEPMTAQRVDVPVELDRIISKAMAKDPGERYQHVDEMQVDLRVLRRSLAVAEHKTPTSRERTLAEPLHEASSRQGEPLARRTQVGLGRWRQLLPWSLVVLAVAVAVWSWIVSRTYRSATQPVVRTRIILPLDQQPSERHFAIPPDGANLVYRVQSAVDQRLYLRALDQFDVRPLPGTELAMRPFFSPGSQWVGFSSRGMLQKVSITGGAPVRICDLPADFTSGAGASWGPDDTIVYNPAGAGLMQVPAAGGEPTVVTTLDIESGERRHSFPQILPNGKDVLFIIRSDKGSHIAVLSLETKERTVLSGLGEAQWAQYLPTGHLVYAHPGEVLAIPFDLERGRATGTPRSLLDDVDRPGGSPALTISQSGSLVYVSGSATDRERSLVWVERDGQATLLAEGIRGSRHPSLSPDGRRVAEAGPGGIWILDVERGSRTLLTDEGSQSRDEGSNFQPAWTPDGGRVAFSSLRPDKDWDVYWKAVDGTGEVEPLLTAQHTQGPTSWSPDGKLLAFKEDNPETGSDIGILSLQGEPRRSAFLATKFNEFSAKFSPDGSWLAYVSDESGQDEVYARPYPGPGPRWPISTDGGQEPVWSPDGRELFYRNGDQMLAVAIATEPAFRAGRPVRLFEEQYEKSPVPAVNYDISPDGKRFLMVREQPRTTRGQFNVVLNWFEELKRLVPEE